MFPDKFLLLRQDKVDDRSRLVFEQVGNREHPVKYIMFGLTERCKEQTLLLKSFGQHSPHEPVSQAPNGFESEERSIRSGLCTCGPTFCAQLATTARRASS